MRTLLALLAAGAAVLAATACGSATAPSATAASPTVPATPRAATTGPSAGGSDGQWLASTCAALAGWLDAADDDEDSLRALVLGGDLDDPAALRRRSLSVVEDATADVRALAAQLESAGPPVDAGLVALDTATASVLADTESVLARLGPQVAALPVEDRDSLAAAGAPLAAELFAAEERLVGELTAALARARASGAGPLVQGTPSCRAVTAELETPGP